MTYQWSLISSPTGSTATLSSASAANPSFVADVAGDYVAQLVVNDGITDSAADTVSISAAVPNTAPIADAGKDAIGAVRAAVFLSAAKSSDPDGDSINFNWIVQNGPAGHNASIANGTNVVARFSGDLEGKYTIAVEVSDGAVTSTDTVTVFIDFDGDGLIGSDDPDVDGDGIPDNADAFANDPSEFLDSDQNGVGNFAQSDEDGDGTDDLNDMFPFDDSKTTYPETVESEFNDNPLQANPTNTSPPFLVTGSIQQDVDGDYFRFPAQSGQFITAVLLSDAPGFMPVLSMANAAGNTLPSVQPAIQGAGFDSAISVLIPTDGDYFIIINDQQSKGDPSFTYQVELFVDQDIDAIDDNREAALGLNNLSADTDSDSIFDAAEFGVTDTQETPILDVDGDMVPNWLDKDTDNDFIVDGAELASDVDGDSIPNFADRDSDGNGILDVSEVGLDATQPLDTDLDGTPDFLDLDDDGDGLVDNIDPDRLVPIAIADPLGDGLVIYTLAIDLGNSQLIEGVARIGDTLLIQGNGFSTTLEDNIVLFEANGSVINITPIAANQNELQIAVPDSTALSQISVVVNNKRSNQVELNVFGNQNPILLEPDDVRIRIGDTVTFEGANFDTQMNVNFNGISATPVTVTSNSLDIVVPDGATSGNVVLNTFAGSSNSVRFEIVKPVLATVTLPANSTLTFDDLQIAYGLLDEATLDGAGQVEVEINNARLDTVFALIPESAPQPETVFLQAISLPGDSAVVVNTLSTAVALMAQGLQITNQVNLGSLAQLRDDISGINEVIALATLLETKLAANPLFLIEPDQE